MRTSHLAALVFVAAVAVHAVTWWGHFAYDDVSVILRDPRIYDVDEWPKLLTRSYWNNSAGNNHGAWRPLTSLSFALNWSLTPARAWSFHLVNTLLHGGVSVLLFLLSRDILRDRRAALLVGLLFALHPAHSEAVASIVGRSEMLAALFGLGAWLLHRRGMAIAPAGLLFLAFVSKESAVPLLAVLAMDDWLGRPGREGGRPTRSEVTRSWPWLIAALLLLFMLRMMVLGSVRGGGADPLLFMNPLLHEDVGFTARLATGLRMLMLHWWLFLVPWRLVSDYTWPQVVISESLLAPAVLGAIAMLLVIRVVALHCERRAPVVTLCLGGWFVTALLTSNILFPIGALFAERFMYIPSVFQCLLVGWLITRVPASRGSRTALPALACIVLALFAAKSIHRAWLWGDQVRLWEHDLRLAPRSAQLHASYAISLAGDDDAAAEPHAREAIALSTWPTTGQVLQGQALVCLSGILMRRAVTQQQAGEPAALAATLAEAEATLLAALERLPGNPKALSLLGIIRHAQGRSEEAEAIFQRLRGSDDPYAIANSARHFLLTGRPELARQVLARAPAHFIDVYGLRPLIDEAGGP